MTYLPIDILKPSPSALLAYFLTLFFSPNALNSPLCVCVCGDFSYLDVLVPQGYKINLN